MSATTTPPKRIRNVRARFPVTFTAIAKALHATPRVLRGFLPEPDYRSPDGTVRRWRECPALTGWLVCGRTAAELRLVWVPRHTARDGDIHMRGTEAECREALRRFPTKAATWPRNSRLWIEQCLAACASDARSAALFTPEKQTTETTKQ